MSLEGFAAARGLEYRNSVRSGRPIAVVPPWARRVFNACTGSVAPHRYGVDGRLTVHLHDLLEPHGRAAVTFPAPAATPDTPPAGVAHEPTDMRVTVTDGLVSCWSRTLQRSTIAPEETSRRALEAARALGYLPRI